MSLNLTGTTTAGKFTGLMGQVGVQYILTPSPGTTAFPVGKSPLRSIRESRFPSQGSRRL